MATPYGETVHGGFFSVEPVSAEAPEMALQVGIGSLVVGKAVNAHSVGLAPAEVPLERPPFLLLADAVLHADPRAEDCRRRASRQA